MDGLKGSSLPASYNVESQELKQKQVTFNYYSTIQITYLASKDVHIFNDKPNSMQSQLINYKGFVKQTTVEVISLRFTPVNGLAVVMYTVIREMFVVKKFLYSSKITKIKHMKYFQHMYYVIEHELNYRKVQKFVNTNILHTNIS